MGEGSPPNAGTCPEFMAISMHSHSEVFCRYTWVGVDVARNQGWENATMPTASGDGAPSYGRKSNHNPEMGAPTKNFVVGWLAETKVDHWLERTCSAATEEHGQEKKTRARRQTETLGKKWLSMEAH